MDAKKLLGGLVLLALAVFGAWQFPDAGDAGDGGSSPEIQDTGAAVRVDGPEGPVDIGPTLARIARGESHSHRNDGSVFQNREGRLPAKPRGYYREYVHPTQGKSGPGAQRVVLGEEGEVYYTPDHYETFQRVERP